MRAELSIAGLVGYEMLKFSDQVRPRYIGHLHSFGSTIFDFSCEKHVPTHCCTSLAAEMAVSVVVASQASDVAYWQILLQKSVEASHEP